MLRNDEAEFCLFISVKLGIGDVLWLPISECDVGGFGGDRGGEDFDGFFVCNGSCKVWLFVAWGTAIIGIIFSRLYFSERGLQQDDKRWHSWQHEPYNESFLPFKSPVRPPLTLRTTNCKRIHIKYKESSVNCTTKFLIWNQKYRLQFRRLNLPQISQTQSIATLIIFDPTLSSSFIFRSQNVTSSQCDWYQCIHSYKRIYIDFKLRRLFRLNRIFGSNCFYDNLDENMKYFIKIIIK